MDAVITGKDRPRGYNGKGFAANGYDKKLAAAFAKWQRIKDTPVPHVKETPVLVTRPAPHVNAPPPKPSQAKEVATTAAGGAAGAGLVLLALVGDAWGKFVAFADWITFWNN